MYGDYTIELDLQQLRADIDSGKLADVEIVDFDQLMAVHRQKVDQAEARYEANPTDRNRDRLEAAQRDMSNTERDQEILIKGVIPSEYFTVSRTR